MQFDFTDLILYLGSDVLRGFRLMNHHTVGLHTELFLQWIFSL